MNVVFARRAQQDIAEIYTTIAAKNPAAAQRVEDAIRLTCETVGLFPFASAATDEPSVRRAPLVRFPYTIFFRVNDAQQIVEIARILHSRRLSDPGRMPD